MQSKKILQLTGKKLRCAALPLGGIGTGSFVIGGDGLLKQWQISNVVRHNAFVPNSFFSVGTKKVGEPTKRSVCRALISPEVHEDPNFKPAEMVSDHKIGTAAKAMFEILPGVEEIRFNGEYPIAFLQFVDNSLPIDISLNTYNPFIPLDPKNSGLPFTIFQFHITNRSNNPCEVILAGHFLNFLGWDGLRVIQGNESNLYGGNVNNHKKIGNWHAIQMKSKTLLKKDRRYGDMTLAIDQPDALIITQWGDLSNFWSHLSQKGDFPKSDSEEMSPIGQTWAGSLGSRKILNPSESMEVNFFFAWNFPNRVVDWYMNSEKIPDTTTEYWIGNRYNEWFNNSLEVIKYVRENLSYLIKETAKFHELLFTSTLPPEVITSISATMSTIKTPSCFWIRDGSFHGFEGCCGASTTQSSGGSCPLNCTHVWNYEFSLAYLFPSLERSMRETEFKMQNAEGFLPHRAILPLYLPQCDMTPPRPHDIPPAIDGMFGMVLKIYRDYLITGDLEFLKNSWTFVKKLMEYIFRYYDKESKGVIYGSQPNTYDCVIYGINTFIGSLYLTALLSCREIAKQLGIFEWVNKCQQLYNSGKEILDNECWNGEYYIQKYDESLVKEFQYGIGCHSDQLIGQWWAFHLDFGYILPPEHINKAVESIIKYNFKDSLQGIQQFRVFASPTDSGLLNCTWPQGKKPSMPIRYSNEVWTGIEYELAALCIYTGKIPEALKIIQTIRDRYSGTRRNPWNEVECGDHYVRAMSSWTLLHALTGVNFSMVSQQFKIGPKINSKDFKTFFITGTAWGQVAQQISSKGLSCCLSISHGKMEIKSILLDKLGGFKPNRCSMFLKENLEGEKNLLKATISTIDSKAEILLTNSIILKEGHQLLIELS